MYILSILLAKYTEMKVLLKSRKTMVYTKLTMTKFWRSIQCIKDTARAESTTLYDKNINQGDLNSHHATSSVRYKIGSPMIPFTTFNFDAYVTRLISTSNRGPRAKSH